MGSGEKNPLRLPDSISHGERHGLPKCGARQGPLLSGLRAELLFGFLNFSYLTNYLVCLPGRHIGSEVPNQNIIGK